MAHRTSAELEVLLGHVRAAPVGTGTLRMIVRRPAVGVREILEEGELNPSVGLVGDTWRERPSSRTEDGGPHPDMQLNVMGWRVVETLAATDEQRAMAGDQLYVDLSLREEDLPVGTRLTIGAARGGTAMIEVTDQPHTGCAKFVERFGADAMRWVNGRTGRNLRLRGINARVLTGGAVRRHDPVVFVQSGCGPNPAQ